MRGDPVRNAWWVRMLDCGARATVCGARPDAVASIQHTAPKTRIVIAGASSRATGDEWHKVKEVMPANYFRQHSTREVEHFEPVFGSDAWYAMMGRLYATGIPMFTNPRHSLTRIYLAGPPARDLQPGSGSSGCSLAPPAPAGSPVPAGSAAHRRADPLTPASATRRERGGERLSPAPPSTSLPSPSALHRSPVELPSRDTASKARRRRRRGQSAPQSHIPRAPNESSC